MFSKQEQTFTFVNINKTLLLRRFKLWFRNQEEKLKMKTYTQNYTLGRNKKLQFKNCVIYWHRFVLKVENRIHNEHSSQHCKWNFFFAYLDPFLN